MMKKRFLCCLCLAIFTAVSLFGFTACSSDQNVSDRLDALESDVDALEAKVEALEAANANFQQKLAALDTSSDTFADDLAELTSNYNSLAASVQNATYIERTVVTKEEVTAGHPIIGSWSPIVTATSGDSGYAVVGCSVKYIEYAPLFQLATCKVQITESQQISTAEVTMTRADLDTSSKIIRGSLVTNITITDINAVSKDWTEIVFYVFH